MGAPPPGLGADNWHTVREGETLSLIAQARYGDPLKWPIIWDANRDQVADANLIEIGWRLFIPPLDVEKSVEEQTQCGMDLLLKRDLEFASEWTLDPKDWEPIGDDNFRLRPGRNPSDAVYRVVADQSALDCAGAVWVSMAYSVLQTLGPEAFDRACNDAAAAGNDLVLGKQVDQGFLYELTQFPEPKSIAELQPGDEVYFKNTPKIHAKHPGSPWKGENTIYRGNGRFTGHGVGTTDAAGVIAALKKEYDKPPSDHERKDPDFDPGLMNDHVAVAEIPGIQWGTVMRLDAEKLASSY